MKLYLVRHAAAIESTPALPDELRYLTGAGRAFFRKTARTMRNNGVEPELLLSSPLVRAVQTADILAETLSFSGPVAVTAELAPGFEMAALRKLLTASPSVKELVIVGHEPDLGRVISALLGLQAGFDFQKGTAVKLKIDPLFKAPAEFKWLASGKKMLTAQPAG